MRILSASLIFSACFFAGCHLFSPENKSLELDATEVFSVTPANGVWDEEYGRTADPRNCSFTFQIVRQVGGLLVRAQVTDDVVVTDDSPFGSEPSTNPRSKPWDDDTFQCYFDGDCDGATDNRSGDSPIWGGEYLISANGVSYSGHSSCPNSYGEKWGARVIVTPNDAKGHTIDYALWFSWECLGLPRPPAEDEDVTFGFNACVHDDDDGGRADRALYWKGSPSTPYSDESKFGRITLKGRKKE